MKKSGISALLLLIILPSSVAFGQKEFPSGLTPELFNSDNPIPIVIKTDLKGLADQMFEKEQYQPAQIIYKDRKFIDTLKTRIRVRGHFRKDTLNCDFPPLRIDFKKNDIRNTIFGPQDQFRIVTHCRTNDTHFVQYIIREYLVYKIYQILNPLSLNVRLALITYEDTEGRYPSYTRYGFILEDEGEFASRFNMEKVNERVTFEELEGNNGLLLSMFEFMIGDTDWIVQFSKNLIILKNGNDIYAVPYDFDYSGIVDTDYRTSTGYTSLSDPERLFKGKCYTTEELKNMIKKFKKSKGKIYRLLYASRQLDNDSLIYMYNYITKFYEIVRSKQEMLKYFNVNCEGNK
jgi:hypothetical protein